MKEYEVIWEIFNKCPRNQMRDVFVDEIELDDPEEYVKNKFKGEDVSYEKTVLEDGTIIFDIQTSQIKQRCSFTCKLQQESGKKLCFSVLHKFLRDF